MRKLQLLADAFRSKGTAFKNALRVDPMKKYKDRVERDARLLNNLFFASGLQGKKSPLFIDMGSNLGQGFEFFQSTIRLAYGTIFY